MNERFAQLSLAEKILAVSLPFGVLHHIDHVLRVDHSGWPFQSEISPFTFTLLIYPAIYLVHKYKDKKKFVASVLGFISIFLIFAHTMTEPPQQVYTTWAQNISTDAPLFRSSGERNLLNQKLPLIGFISVSIHAAITLLILSAFLVSLRDVYTYSKNNQKKGGK